MTVSHTVHRAVPAPVERVFDVVVAEDVLPKVLKRWGPVPGVRGTRDVTGPWHEPGASRTVVLEDGSTVRETVVRWRRASDFEYRVDRLTGPFGRLVDHAIGTWTFEPTPAGARFTWVYTFCGRNRLASTLLRAFVPVAWARYMEQCADLSVELALGHR